MKKKIFFLIAGSFFSIAASAQNRMNRYLPSPNYNPGNYYNYSHRQYSQQEIRAIQMPDYTPKYDKVYKQKYDKADIPSMPSNPNMPSNINRQFYEYKDLYDYLPR